jgi:hypothetical protein
MTSVLEKTMHRKTCNYDKYWANPKLQMTQWYPVAGLILISEYFLLGLLAR